MFNTKTILINKFSFKKKQSYYYKTYNQNVSYNKKKGLFKLKKTLFFFKN